MKSGWISRTVKIAAFVALGIAGMGLLLMLLWNVLIPDIFNGPRISFLQALGLLLLGRILFMSFRPWGFAGSYGKKSEYWRKKFEEKVANMPPEQREKIKQAYARRCGGWYREQSTTVASQETPVQQPVDQQYSEAR